MSGANLIRVEGYSRDDIEPSNGVRWWQLHMYTTENWMWLGSYLMMALQWAAILYVLIGVTWFFVRLPNQQSQDSKTSTLYNKHGRLWVKGDMVVLYNFTTYGVMAASDALVVGVPPGSGYMILNKKRSDGMLHDHGFTKDQIFDQNEDEIIVAHTLQNERRARALGMHGQFVKRSIDATNAAPPAIPDHWAGAINIVDGRDIVLSSERGQTGTGGSIIGAQSVQAANLMQTTLLQDVPATVGQNIGSVVGPLINGSFGLGYATNPSQDVPLVNQEQFIDTDDADLLSVVRFSPTSFVLFYQINGTAIDAVVCQVDANNHKTCAAPVPFISGIVTDVEPKFASLDDNSGSYNNTVLAIFADASIGGNNNVRYQVCKYTTAFACDVGLVGVPGHAHINDLSVLSGATAGASRIAVIGYTDANGGWVQGFSVSAQVGSQSPVLGPRTQIGIVNNLTDTSTSNDLANQVDAIYVDRLDLAHVAITWRTGSGSDQAKVQIMSVNTSTNALTLVTRSPNYMVSPYDNADANSWNLDVSVSAAQTYAGQVTYILATGYNIGFSSFGKLTVQLVSNPFSTNATWFYSQTTEFTSKIVPVYTSGFTAAPLTVESVCQSQILISFVSTRDGSFEGVTVLANVFPTQACVAAGNCISLSSAASFSTVLAYDLKTAYRTYASDSFACASGTPSSFITVFTVYADSDVLNTSIYAAPGLAGAYTVSYAPRDVPRFATGLITAYNAQTQVASVVTQGTVNLCQLVGNVAGHTCALEAPLLVYACPSGAISSSPYCGANNARGVIVPIGFSDIFGNTQFAFPDVPIAA